MNATQFAELRHHLGMIQHQTDDPTLAFRAALALAAVEPTPLVQCPVCERTGLPERIFASACPHA
jgi:hypothetical protein